MKRFFAVLLAAMLLLSVLPAVSSAEQTATVVGGWLRLRSYGSYSAQVLNSYYTGTVVTILDGPVNNWYHVRTPDGSTGYMLGTYLKLGSTPTPGTNAYVTSSNGLSVRLRSGPATTYSVIRSYAVGTPVTVLTSGAVWSYVSIYGQSGYMMSQFLTSVSPTPGPVVGYATIWSANGYGVRLRTGASTSYSVIGTYSVGTRVDILQKGSYWDYIRVGSRTGYMMNQFLIYDSANQVTGVSLNNVNPSVGDVLSILSLTPAGATVSYQWKVGGVVKGTSAKYTVTSADVGKTIQLKVTGTGAYTGSASSSITNPVKSETELTSLTLSTYAPTVDTVLSANISPAGADVVYSWYVGNVYTSSNATYTVTASDVGKQIYLIVSGVSPYTGTLTSGKTDAVTGSKALTALTITNVTSSTRGVSAPESGDVLRVLYVPTDATVTIAWYRGSTLISGAGSCDYTLTDGDVGSKITAEVTGYGSYTGTKSVTTGKVKEASDVPVITTTYLPEGTVGSTYSTVLTAEGANVTWSLASGYSLPEGLSLSSGGMISGTPTTVGDTTLRVKASNSYGYDTKDLNLRVNAALDLPAITTTSLPEGTVGTSYSAALNASGSNVSWMLATGYDMPEGLTLSSDGLISGTPTTVGDTTLRLVAYNENGQDAKDLTLRVNAQESADLPEITTTSLKNAKVGEGYSATLSASGSGISWSLETGYQLPEGLSLNSSTGEISGTPTTAGTVPLRVIAKNSDGQDARDLTLTVEEADPVPEAVLTVTGVDFGKVTEGSSLSSKNITVTNTGDATATGVTVSVSNADFLLGTTFLGDVAASGSTTLSVEPAVTAAGTYSATVTVTYNGGKTASANVTLTIEEAPVSPSLLGISAPEAVTGIANGTAIEDIALPQYVTISTTDGSKTAYVASYDRGSAAYDPSSPDSQTFTVTGTILLPDGVENPNGVSLNFTVSVTVDQLVVYYEE